MMDAYAVHANGHENQSTLILVWIDLAHILEQGLNKWLEGAENTI